MVECWGRPTNINHYPTCRRQQRDYKHDLKTRLVSSSLQTVYLDDIFSLPRLRYQCLSCQLPVYKIELDTVRTIPHQTANENLHLCPLPDLTLCAMSA